MQLTKYIVFADDDESEEELFERLQDNIFRYVEINQDISATIVKQEGTKQIEVKILKLNEYRN